MEKLAVEAARPEMVSIEKRTAMDLCWATPRAKELVAELEGLANDSGTSHLVRLAAKHLVDRATTIHSVLDCLNRAAFPDLPS